MLYNYLYPKKTDVCKPQTNIFCDKYESKYYIKTNDHTSRTSTVTILLKYINIFILYTNLEICFLSLFLACRLLTDYFIWNFRLHWKNSWIITAELVRPLIQMAILIWWWDKLINCNHLKNTNLLNSLKLMFVALFVINTLYVVQLF